MTEMQMFECLKPMFPDNEYALIPQVRNGTGFLKQVRTADAVAVSLWPSRGIYLTGFEFKDSRSDVLKELSDSSKSEEIGRHCAYWWLVVSNPRLISKNELPPAWGLIAISDGVAKKVVAAPKRNFQDPDLSLVASILKAGSKSVTGEDDVKRRINTAVAAALDAERKASEQREKRIASSSSEKSSSYDERLREAHLRFKKETGIDILYPGYPADRLGKSVRFVMESGLDHLPTMISWCERVASEAKQLFGEQ